MFIKSCYKNKNMKITRFDEHACMNYKNKNMKITRFDEHT
jgi:UDP-galactopyranose mutase